MHECVSVHTQLPAWMCKCAHTIPAWMCKCADTHMNVCVHTWTYTDTCMKVWVCTHTQLPIWMCKGAHTWTHTDTRYLPECMSVHTHKHTDTCGINTMHSLSQPLNSLGALVVEWTPVFIGIKTGSSQNMEESGWEENDSAKYKRIRVSCDDINSELCLPCFQWVYGEEMDKIVREGWKRAFDSQDSGWTLWTKSSYIELP